MFFVIVVFLLNDTATTEIYTYVHTLALHDALPICREVNYSSDIDPIFLFDPETLPRRAREDPIDAAQRIGRRVVELLSARDGDGYVFRVDLRLDRTSTRLNSSH